AFVRELLAAARALTRTPVLVKLSPDLGPEAAAELAAAAVDAGAAGIVATNTTTDYALLPGAKGPGGLSGQVLRERRRGGCGGIARRLRGGGGGAGSGGPGGGGAAGGGAAGGGAAGGGAAGGGAAGGGAAGGGAAGGGAAGGGAAAGAAGGGTAATG